MTDPFTYLPRTRAALYHLKAIFPVLEYAIFFGDGRWLFVDDNHDTPDFDERVDVSLLEDAVIELEKQSFVPVVFEM